MRGRHRSAARHEGSARIYRGKKPGLCIGCGKQVQHLYPRPDGSGLHVCYECKKEGK